MSPRLPTSADFPPNFTFDITPPPFSKTPVNILILLHGLGGTHTSFTQLGQRLSLPETACMSLQGLTPMPFDLGGFHWGDDIIFDQSTGTMDVDTGFKKSGVVISEVVIRTALIEKCGYAPRDIMLFGYGQGGMAALATAAKYGDEFGGVVSVGGAMPLSAVAEQRKPATPILLLGGMSGSSVTPPAIKATTDSFSAVEIHQWKRAGDEMPTNREEILPIMRFFARQLRSRASVPAGGVEII